MRLIRKHIYKDSIKSHIKSVFISESILKNRTVLEFTILNQMRPAFSSSFFPTTRGKNDTKFRDDDLQKAFQELNRNNIKHISVDYDANKITIIVDNDQVTIAEYIMKKYSFSPFLRKS